MEPRDFQGEHVKGRNDRLGHLVLQELHRTARVLKHDIYDSIDQAVLLECGQRLQRAVDDLAQDVYGGRVSVDSLGVLKAFKTVNCPDLTKDLVMRDKKRSELAKELRLMINTFENIIRPRTIS